MSISSVREFLANKAPDLEIIELDESTATVELAAKAHGVQPGQIAKTLALRVGDAAVLIVASGDLRLDNKKLKGFFGKRTKMMPATEVAEITGHPVGGVCPFGLANELPIYCDESLNKYDYVLPAAGSLNSAVKIKPDHLVSLTNANWADLCSYK